MAMSMSVSGLRPAFGKAADHLRGLRAGRARRAGVAATAGLALVLALPGVATAAAGDLDPTFGGDGKVMSDLAVYEDSQDVALQPDGKIVTAGTIWAFEGPGDFTLARTPAHLHNGLGRHAHELPVATTERERVRARPHLRLLPGPSAVIPV